MVEQYEAGDTMGSSLVGPVLIRLVLILKCSQVEAEVCLCAADLRACAHLHMDHIPRTCTRITSAILQSCHVQATEDLGWVGYTLGSQRIKELVYQKAKLGRWRDLTEMLRAAAEEPTLGKMTGDLLEQYGHDMCQHGIALDPEDVKEVSKGTVGRPRKETEAEKRQREQARGEGD